MERKACILNNSLLFVGVLLWLILNGLSTKAAIPADATKWCGHYYKLYDNMGMTYEETVDYCSDMGGYLATYSSNGEKAVLDELLPYAKEGLSYLTGNSKMFYVYAYWWESIVGGTGKPSHRITYWAMKDGVSDNATGLICEWGDTLTIESEHVSISKTEYIYTGKVCEPEITITYEGVTLEKDNDYTLAFKGDRTSIGSHEIVIEGIGRFKGKVIRNYVILPTVPKNVSGRCENGRNIRFTWSGVAGYVSGYEIEYSGQSTFAVSEKDTVKNGSNIQTTEYLLEELGPSEHQYFRVRAYKTVGLKKYYSGWSASAHAMTDPELIAGDFWGFGNFNGWITKKYFEKYFGPEQAKTLARDKGRNGSGGVCFGMAITALGTLEQDNPHMNSYGSMGVKSLSELTSKETKISSLDLSVKEYIYYAQAFQSTKAGNLGVQENRGELSQLYNQVKYYGERGQGVPIRVFSVNDRGKKEYGHSIVGLSIISETDSEVQIKVYDSNYPKDENRILYLYRENNKFTSWQYSIDNNRILTGNNNIKQYLAGEQNDIITYEDADRNFLRAWEIVHDPSVGEELLVTSAANGTSFDIKEALDKTHVVSRELDSTNGDDLSHISAYFLRVNSSFTLQNVPKGTEIYVAAPYHSVMVNVDGKADIYFDIDDTKENFVYLDMKENASYTVRYSDSAVDSDKVEVTTIKGKGKKGTKVTVYQKEDSTVEVKGSTTLEVTRQNGKEDEEGNLVNPTVNAINISKVDSDTTYQYSVKGNTSIVKSRSEEDYSFHTVVASSAKPKKGATFKVGNFQYKITKVTGAGGNVTLTKVLKKTAKVKVPDVVEYKGFIYKVTQIGSKAFMKNTKIKSIVVGKNITIIGKQAFMQAKNLKSITIKSLVLKKVGSKAFSGIHKKAVMKVPEEKYNIYKKVLKNKGQKSSVKIKKFN